jgi:hypothetical protein
MAEETGFTIGAKATCSDGYCGEVSIVIDPAAREVTHLVVETKHRREPGRLVPLDLIDTTAGGIRLRCTLAEFGRLDLAEETELVGDLGYADDYGQAEAAQGYGGVGSMGVGGSISGMGIGMGLGLQPQAFVQEVVPLGESQVRHGEHVLLQEGHLWGRKEVAIPVSAVSGVDDGIRLTITRKQVGDLPPVG